MQPVPAPPAQAQPMPAMQPMAAYQPQPKFLDRYGSYSFERWLMIGVILVVAAALFNQIPNITGGPEVPVSSDVDDLEKYADELSSHNSLVRIIGAFASMMQAVSIGLISYALIREGYDGSVHHTALRVTAIIGGILLISNLASSSIDLF
jgi:hypothetical protein